MHLSSIWSVQGIVVRAHRFMGVPVFSEHLETTWASVFNFKSGPLILQVGRRGGSDRLIGRAYLLTS